LREARRQFAPLTSLEKLAFVTFGAVMHVMVLAQLVLIGWLLLIALRSQR